MSLKLRGTNNSVSTLEDQSSVISAISTMNSLETDKSANKTTTRVKSVNKKKENKERTSKSPLQLLEKEMQQTMTSPPAVTTSPTVVSTVMQPVAQVHSGQTSQVNLTSENPVDFATQQQWLLWQQHQISQQIQQLNQNYGNFVPNFTFGANVETPLWANEELGQDSDVQSQTLHAHTISDDESDLNPATDEGDLSVEQSASLVGALNPPLEQVTGSGKVIDFLKSQLAQVKDADKVSPKAGPGVALLLDKYFVEMSSLMDLEKLAKSYPRVENVQKMKVPRLDNEIYQVLDQRSRNLDLNMQAVQKGVIGAISAFTPLLALMCSRADKDEELDALGQNIIDGMYLLVRSVNAISGRRREILKPSLAPTYAKALTRGHETTEEWLYGGDLVNTTKMCEASKKISEKILKRKDSPRPTNNQQKRSRFQTPSAIPALRAFNPYQGYRFPNPQNFAGFYPNAPPPMFPFHSVPNYFRQRNPRPAGRGFQKKGAYQK